MDSPLHAIGYWPEDHRGTTVNTQLNWDKADPRSFEDTSFTHSILGQIPPKRLAELKVRYPTTFALFSDDLKEMVDARIVGRAAVTRSALCAVKVSSIENRMLEIEQNRAEIPVGGIIQAMLDSIHTGQMGATPLTARDKIDLMKFLVNKVLPDAKSLDVDDRAKKADRKAAPIDRVDLSSLTRDELLDLMRKTDLDER